jgi:hypothetical protein
MLRNRARSIIPIQQMRILRPNVLKKWHTLLSPLSPIHQPPWGALENARHFLYEKHMINLKQHMNSGLSPPEVIWLNLNVEMWVCT